MGFLRHSIRASDAARVPGAADRRRTCRYRVLFHDADLGWWEGSTFIQTPAQLVNLSLHGCMLELQRLPARTLLQPVWVRSHAATSREWDEGIVLFVRKPFIRRCRIRIAFRVAFPYQSFKTLVYGTEDLDGSIRDGAAPPHERDHYWK